LTIEAAAMIAVAPIKRAGVERERRQLINGQEDGNHGDT
jgi:hypothetical protein